MEPLPMEEKRSPLDQKYSPFKQLTTDFKLSSLTGSTLGFGKSEYGRGSVTHSKDELYSISDPFKQSGGSGASIDISQELFKTKYGGTTFSLTGSGSKYEGKESELYSSRRTQDVSEMLSSRYSGLFTEKEKSVASSSISGDPDIKTASFGGKFTFSPQYGILGDPTSKMKISLGGGGTYASIGEHVERGTTKLRETTYHKGTPGSYASYTGSADVLSREDVGSVLSGGSGDFTYNYPSGSGGTISGSGTNTLQQIMSGWSQKGSTSFSKGLYQKHEKETSFKPYISGGISQKFQIGDYSSIGYNVFAGTKYSPEGTGFEISAGHKKFDIFAGYKQKSGGGGQTTFGLQYKFGGKKKGWLSKTLDKIHL